MVSKVTFFQPSMGCDPEFFFRNKGEVVGAEKVIPKDGITVNRGYPFHSKFIIDGVQAELNPRPNTCRDSLANEIMICMQTLRATMQGQDKNLTADFGRTIEISKEKLNELSDNAKKFGCAPSKSIDKRPLRALLLNKVNPEEYRIRAAGGHIHIGGGHETIDKALKKDTKKTVEMLDIILGNTCVLIDRDKGNIERRKLYGKAGEYRTPPHGLEYRTLSNFWLTSMPLFYFAFGLARLAIILMADKNSEEFYKEFTSKVNRRNIIKAINNNDYDVAMNNFDKIKDLICEVSQDKHNGFVIRRDNIDGVLYFIDMINKNGLEHFFPLDPLTHWSIGNAKGNTYLMGFESFMVKSVIPEMKKTIPVAA